MLKFLVLIPTFDRSDLAVRAVRSALEQSCEALQAVVVSDNSDDPQETQILSDAVRSANDQRLEYMKPPSSMNMGAHWDWAIHQCIERFSPTHIMVLTDRMVFRGQAMSELARIASRFPDGVVSFQHDRVNDLRTPVVLERANYSENLYKIDCKHLLMLSSLCVFHPSLPRLLNALTPTACLQKVKEAFGSYCQSVSPDFGFAYRHLAVTPDLLYYDKALTIHSGIARSNGASTTRGILSKEAVKFRATNNFTHAPYPEIFSLGNSILEEYCRVKATSNGENLPSLDAHSYFKMLVNDALLLEDRQRRQQIFTLLKKRGHGIELRWRLLRHVFKLKSQWIEKGFKRKIRDRRAVPRTLMFATVEAALAYDRDYPHPASENLGHLKVVNASPVRAEADSSP